jgi:5,5'-dehydrodivanillate O-demethylase
VDDTHTLHFWFCWYDVPAGFASLAGQVRGLPDTYEVRLRGDDGVFLMNTIDSQDAMVWVSQGPLTTRDDEHLSSSDQGIALYRNLLRRQLDACEAGGAVMNVRDAATAHEVIELPQEKKELGIGGGGANPVATFLRTQALYSRRLAELSRRIDAELAKAG